MGACERVGSARGRRGWLRVTVGVMILAMPALWLVVSLSSAVPGAAAAACWRLVPVSFARSHADAPSPPAAAAWAARARPGAGAVVPAPFTVPGLRSLRPATRPPRDGGGAPRPTLDGLTFVAKAFERPACLRRLLQSIGGIYRGAAVVVLDDSRQALLGKDAVGSAAAGNLTVIRTECVRARGSASVCTI